MKVYIGLLFAVVVYFTGHSFSSDSNVSLFTSSTLSESELLPVLDTWDYAVRNDTIIMKYKAMNLVSKKVNIDEYKGVCVLRYSNKEIISRVIALYIKELSRYPHYKIENITADDKKKNPWLGTDEGYMQLLTSLTESTFSDIIYDSELKPIDVAFHPLRLLYLSKVNPQHTLNAIFASTLGEKKGGMAHYSYLYANDESGYALFELDEALELITMINRFSPDMFNANKRSILEFTKKHSMSLSISHQVRDQATPTYTRLHDYRTRYFSLEILQLLGDQSHIDLAQSIERNAPQLTSLEKKYLNKTDLDTIEAKANKTKELLGKIK